MIGLVYVVAFIASLYIGRTVLGVVIVTAQKVGPFTHKKETAALAAIGLIAWAVLSALVFLMAWAFANFSGV